MPYSEIFAYKNRKLEGASYLETMVDTFFKLASLMNQLTKALQAKDYENVFNLSKKASNILVAFESILENEQKEQLEQLIQFFKLASLKLVKVNLDSDVKLAQEMEDSFKAFGKSFQEAFEEQRIKEENSTSNDQEKTIEIII